MPVGFHAVIHSGSTRSKRRLVLFFRRIRWIDTAYLLANMNPEYRTEERKNHDEGKGNMSA